MEIIGRYYAHQWLGAFSTIEMKTEATHI